jgi:predicted MFS family arabinose efflux permease
VTDSILSAEPETKDADEELRPVQHYLRGLGLSTRHNTVAYGYTVTITVAFAALLDLSGSPSIAELFLFVAGAGLAFAAVNAATTRGYSDEPPDEPAVVLSLGTSLSAISIAIALGAACLVGWVVPPWPSWPVGSFVASLTYLMAVAAEMALAGSRHREGEANPDSDRRG